MKILMLTDNMDLGGAETHIFTLVSELLKMGHSVVAVSSGGSLAQRLSDEYALPHLTLPLHSKRIPDLIRSYFSLSRLIKKEHFDLIHSHARLPSLLASRLSKRSGIPLICTAHAKFCASGIRKRLSRWGDLSIAVGEDLKQYLTDLYGIPPENIHTVPNGVDTSLFTPASRTDSVLNIGFLSRLEGDCSVGAYILCDLARDLCSALGRVRISIGGGGSEYEDLCSLAEGINRELGFECISMLGKIADVPAFMSSCKLFVGVSRAAIEAAACGVGVIICGNEGYFGRLTPERFEEALYTNFCARGCALPSADKLFCDILASVGADTAPVRSLIESTLSAEKMAKDTQAVYEKALLIKRKKHPEVLLCGYYGYGNMGDDALLRAAISRSRECFPDLSVGALTRRPRKDSKDFGITCIGRYSPIGVVSALCYCKHFILGGGTLLQSSTSLRSLLYYCFVLRLAALFGARAMLWANGIGELPLRSSKALVRNALKRCEYIGLRDAVSLQRARELLPSAQAVLESDLAMYTEPSAPCRCKYILDTVFASEGKFLPFSIIAPRNADGLSELEKALAEAKRAGKELLFVAMHKGEDTALCQALCERLGGRLLTGISYPDLLGIAKFSDRVYSMRFHGLLAARSVGVPYKAFGKDEKLRSL